MLQLRDVLQFVVDGLDDSPLANEDLVGDAHQAVLHVVPHPGYQLYPVCEQLMEQLLGYIAFVAYQLAVYLLHEVLDLERFPVVDVRRGNHKA